MEIRSDFDKTQFDLQGHRGCRGLLPENSIEAFLHAVDLGVNTLELDICISKDKKVVVSHEPWLNPEICALDGEYSEKDAKSKFNMFQMDYSDIKNIDCGSKVFDRFPEQKKLSSYKPLLTELFDTIEAKIIKENLTPLHYNIEIKLEEDRIGIFHPDRKEFFRLFYNIIQERNIKDRVSLQCFDFGVLQIARKYDPKLELVALVSNRKSVEKNLEKLGFDPDIYSPKYTLLSKSDVESLQARSIKVIPWTVNETSSMVKMINMGVDGLITDYPNRLNELLSSF